MTHEEMLQLTIDKLSEAGLRVIRLDTRNIPDAFTVVNNKVIAIEIESDGSPKYSRNSEFDEVITISPQKLYKKDHSPELYLYVLQLRKSGKSYKKIQSTVKSEKNIHLGTGTIHNWCRGKQIPRTIKITMPNSKQILNKKYNELL